MKSACDCGYGGRRLSDPDFKGSTAGWADADIDLIEISGGTYEAPAMTGMKVSKEPVKESTRQREAYGLARMLAIEPDSPKRLLVGKKPVHQMSANRKPVRGLRGSAVEGERVIDRSTKRIHAHENTLGRRPIQDAYRRRSSTSTMRQHTDVGDIYGTQQQTV